MRKITNIFKKQIPQIKDDIYNVQAWIQATNCEICKKKFKTLSERKHQCKRCHFAVCSSCSKTKYIILGLDQRAHRVCDTCKQEITYQKELRKIVQFIIKNQMKYQFENWNKMDQLFLFRGVINNNSFIQLLYFSLFFSQILQQQNQYSDYLQKFKLSSTAFADTIKIIEDDIKLNQEKFFTYNYSLREFFSQSQEGCTFQQISQPILNIYKAVLVRNNNFFYKKVILIISLQNQLFSKELLQPIIFLLCFLQEEHAFWIFCFLIERLFPPALFKEQNMGIQEEFLIINTMLKKLNIFTDINDEKLYFFLEKFIKKSFLSQFVNSLNFQCTYFIWDQLLQFQEVFYKRHYYICFQFIFVEKFCLVLLFMHQTAIKRQLTNQQVKPLHPDYHAMSEYFKDDPDISMILCDEFFQTQFIRYTQITDFKLAIQKFDSYIVTLYSSLESNESKIKRSQSTFDNTEGNGESKALLLKIRREILTSFDLKNYLNIQNKEERAQTLQTISPNLAEAQLDLNKLRFSNILSIELKKQKQVRRSRSLIVIKASKKQKQNKELHELENKQLLNANRELTLKLQTSQNKFMQLTSESNEYKSQHSNKLLSQEKSIHQLKIKIQQLEKQLEFSKLKNVELKQKVQNLDQKENDTLIKLKKTPEIIAKMEMINNQGYEKLSPDILISKLIKSKVKNIYLQQEINNAQEEKEQSKNNPVSKQLEDLQNKISEYNKQFSRILQEFKKYENNDIELLLNEDFINKIMESKDKVLQMEKQLKEANEIKEFLSYQLEQKAIENANLRKLIEEEQFLNEKDDIESIDLRTEKTESLLDSKQLFKSMEKFRQNKQNDQPLDKNQQICEVCKIF